jgi:hypothetical protein
LYSIANMKLSSSLVSLWFSVVSALSPSPEISPAQRDTNGILTATGTSSMDFDLCDQLICFLTNFQAAIRFLFALKLPARAASWAQIMA